MGYRSGDHFHPHRNFTRKHSQTHTHERKHSYTYKATPQTRTHVGEKDQKVYPHKFKPETVLRIQKLKIFGIFGEIVYDETLKLQSIRFRGSKINSGKKQLIFFWLHETACFPMGRLSSLEVAS